MQLYRESQTVDVQSKGSLPSAFEPLSTWKLNLQAAKPLSIVHSCADAFFAVLHTPSAHPISRRSLYTLLSGFVN